VNAANEKRKCSIFPLGQTKYSIYLEFATKKQHFCRSYTVQ